MRLFFFFFSFCHDIMLEIYVYEVWQRPWRQLQPISFEKKIVVCRPLSTKNHTPATIFRGRNKQAMRNGVFALAIVISNGRFSILGSFVRLCGLLGSFLQPSLLSFKHVRLAFFRLQSQPPGFFSILFPLGTSSSYPFSYSSPVPFSFLSHVFFYPLFLFFFFPDLELNLHTFWSFLQKNM